MCVCVCVQHGLFEDIAQGLRQAHCVICCVSDQYVTSSNCLMEFRFAANVLRLPTILAVVGTSNNWRKSQVCVAIYRLMEHFAGAPVEELVCSVRSECH